MTHKMIKQGNRYKHQATRLKFPLFFLKEEKKPPSSYLHTVRDYIKQEQGHTDCHTEKNNKLFHYLLHIKVDLKRKPGFKKVKAF